MELTEIAQRFVRITGLMIPDLRSKKRGPVLPGGRIDLTAIAVVEYILAAGNAAIDVVRGFREKKAGMSRHGTPSPHHLGRIPCGGGPTRS